MLGLRLVMTHLCLAYVWLRLMIDYVHSIILSYVDCHALWLFDDAKGGEKWGGIEA